MSAAAHFFPFHLFCLFRVFAVFFRHLFQRLVRVLHQPTDLLVNIIKRHDAPLVFGVRFQPFRKVAADGHNASAGGLGLCRLDLDEFVGQMNFAPVQPTDLRRAQARERADGEEWQQFRSGMVQELRNLQRRINRDVRRLLLKLWDQFNAFMVARQPAAFLAEFEKCADGRPGVR